MRKSEDRYNTAELIGHFAHWDQNFSEGKASWSKGTRNIFGVDLEQLRPSHDEFLKLVHPSDKERLKQAIENAFSSGGSLDIEYRILRPDQTERFIHSIGEIHSAETGRSRKLVGTIHDITERKQVEDKLKWELNVNSVLSELYKPLTTPSAQIEGITKIILEKAKILTDSEHGYVSSIDPVTGDNISHTLTEMMKDQCEITDDNKKSIIFPKGEDGLYPGLWGYTLNTKAAFLCNSPQTHEASTGIPDGHIPIRRLLSVPVILGQELVGQISLANKKQDYTERDAEAIRRLAEYYALAIQRKRVEDELREAHDELELRIEERTVELLDANTRLKLEITERKQAEEKILKYQEDLRLLTSELSLAEEGERRRIAIDLHDRIGQALAMSKINV
ncbi:MAG: GAF domain-containing protein, partial [Deltaproteobacteria bacterium]|nr:GAF domain-containing protein [Deltaproteobacteria bacterium]